MKIAVLGGGHGCYAAAADLAEAGHDVRLWRRDAAALAPLCASGSIVLKDARGSREVPIAVRDRRPRRGGRGRRADRDPVARHWRRTTSRAPSRRTSSTARSSSCRRAPSAATRWRRSCAPRRQPRTRRLRRDRHAALAGAQARRTRGHVTMRAMRLPTGVYPRRRRRARARRDRAGLPERDRARAATRCRAR